MAIDYKQYVGWWRQFSEYVRFERAQNVCECTGQCGYTHDGRCTARNGEVGKMGKDGIWRNIDSIHALNSDWGEALYGEDFDFVGSKVCLTVAHLDYDGGACQCKKTLGIKCAIPSHCLAMCNFCHLTMDLPHHIENRKRNLMEKRDSERSLLSYLTV